MAEPIVDGKELVRIIAASLYIPRVQGYPHSAELLELKRDGSSADIYANLLEQVIAIEMPEHAAVGLALVPSATTRVIGPGVRTLGASLGGLLNLPVLDVITFNRDVITQKSAKSRPGRVSNISGSMAAQQPVPPSLIFALDDITTTGATLREAARALCSAGASGVVGLAAGRDDSLEHLARVGVIVEANRS